MTYVLGTYSFIFMLWAGSLWFDVFLLQILLLPFVVVGVIFSICLAVKNIRHKKSLQERIISLIPFVIAILCMAMLFLPTDWKVYVDHCLFQTQRLNAIEKILREHLSEEQVDLPHRWLSCNGQAWIFDQEKNLLVSLLKTACCHLVGLLFILNKGDRQRRKNCTARSLATKHYLPTGIICTYDE